LWPQQFYHAGKASGLPIHTPPGVWLVHTGVRALTRTQLAAKWKAEKELKARAAKDGKLAMAACKFAAQKKKQDSMISVVESKASRVASKDDKLRLKLVDAVKASTREDPP
jgi:hypothetical protein